ncbi:MAG: Patatin [Acidimicrobiales bacterium]|nr:Patatin [Acidimicrobiales bacterium]
MTKALVLGGGGVAGIAWELGVVAGLRDGGVDVTAPDFAVGTSAGSVVGAQVLGAQLLAGADVDELYERQLGPAATSGEPVIAFDLDVLMPIFREMAADPDDTRRRARIGALAVAAETPPESARRAIIAGQLPSHDWPGIPLVVTAVDVASGEFVTFDRDSGVGLVDAVAASCAVPGIWPPVTIGDRRYMDGGVRTVTNADLAAAHDRVLVLVPIKGFGQYEAEIAAMEASGRVVVSVVADDASAAAIGPNPLDPATRKPSAEAGRRQGLAAAADVAARWEVSPSARR